MKMEGARKDNRNIQIVIFHCTLHKQSICKQLETVPAGPVKAMAPEHSDQVDLTALLRLGPSSPALGGSVIWPF